MKKLLVFLTLFFLSTNSNTAAEKISSLFKDEGNLIFIRHALAPGSGDPSGFSLNDCSSQRNLNSVGIKQSIEIGNFFKNLNIGAYEVLTSEWCRCVDTAKYAFSDFEIFKPLNSFYDSKYIKNKDKQIVELKKYIDNWKNSNKNLILVTHYVVILEILDIPTSSGEIIITDKDLNIIASIKSIKKIGEPINWEKFQINIES